MRVKIFHWWWQLRSSYWFVPSIIAFAGAMLAMITVWIDGKVRPSWVNDLIWIYGGGADGARTMLSAIAGSVITVAGVVFSITVAALTLASTQFGPRLLRSFMRDTGNQVVLGVFLATELYCLLVLRTVRGTDQDEFVPHISVTVGVLLATASMCVLIYFIHHIALSIQAPNVIRAVQRDMFESLDEVFPESLGEGDRSESPAEEMEDPGGPFQSIRSCKDGYLELVDESKLLKLTCEHDWLARLVRRPGDYVIKDDELVRIWPRSAGQISGEMRDQVRQVFALGAERTPTQDLQYTFDQLVEIAVRALSPGINDPYTAIGCIDALTSGLARLANRKIPSPLRRDGQGEVRVISRPITFAGSLRQTIDPIRHYGRNSPMVLDHLQSALEHLANETRDKDRRQTLSGYLSSVKDGRESGRP